MVTKAAPKRKINFRLPPEVYRKAESLAGRLGISLNDLFTLAVSVYLATERKEPKQ
jgi:predicted HicB family RNase H-like nuclease